jgi:hypothetical protein
MNKLLCVFVFVISISVIIGHLFQVPYLTSWIADGIQMTIVTAFCFMLTATMCYVIIMHLDNSFTRFLVITLSFMIFFTILIMALIMYLEMYLANTSFINKYLPAIPTMVLFLLAALKGMTYSFSHKKIGLKIKLLSFGSIGIAIVGFMQYVSNNSFLREYYPTYNVGMSFITCTLTLITAIVFFGIAKSLGDK